MVVSLVVWWWWTRDFWPSFRAGGVDDGGSHAVDGGVVHGVNINHFSKIISTGHSRLQVDSANLTFPHFPTASLNKIQFFSSSSFIISRNSKTAWLIFSQPKKWNTLSVIFLPQTNCGCLKFIVKTNISLTFASRFNNEKKIQSLSCLSPYYPLQCLAIHRGKHINNQEKYINVNISIIKKNIPRKIYQQSRKI